MDKEKFKNHDIMHFVSYSCKTIPSREMVTIFKLPCLQDDVFEMSFETLLRRRATWCHIFYGYPHLDVNAPLEQSNDYVYFGCDNAI